MAKKLTNKSKHIQCLKTSTPGRIGGLYSSSIILQPGQTITVSDEDYAAMTISPDFIGVTFVADDVVDTRDEVEALVGTSNQIIVNQDLNAQSEDAETHGVLINAPGDDLGLSIGVDEDYVYLQTWNTKPLVLNEEGNPVIAGQLHALDDELVSVNVDNRSLHDQNSDITVTWRNMQLIHPSVGTSLDWAFYLLYDTLVREALNWNTRALKDVDEADSVLWGFRELKRADGTVTVNWNNQYLANEDGETAFSWNPSMLANTTASRPVGLIAVGFYMFDTTLGKPTWWNGTNWVDATGTIV